MNIHCICIYIIQILDYKIYVWNFLGQLVIIFIEYLWIFERYKYTNRVWDFQSINIRLKLNALKTPLKWLWEQMLLCELILTPLLLLLTIWFIIMAMRRYVDISICCFIIWLSVRQFDILIYCYVAPFMLIRCILNSYHIDMI